MDGKVVYSCTSLAIEAQGKDIQTIEGFSQNGKLHPVSAAFVNHDAQQCGYCTPGFVVAVKGFLDKHPNPTEEDVEHGTGRQFVPLRNLRGNAQSRARSREGNEGRTQCLIRPNYSWPPMEKRRVLGKATKRLDGPMKSTGRAKYSSDFTQKDLLHGALLTSPHAHARVTSIDTSEAEKLPGVTAVRVIASAGTELMWAGQEVASVAAETEEIAKDATRKIKVQYEVLPHLVREDDLAKAGTRAKAAGEQVKGDPDKAFQEADAMVEGHYGIPVITHCCLEPHGNVVEWKGDKLNLYPSTQNVSGIGGDLSQNLKVPATNVHTNMQYIGGGFGSKFAADLWGVEAARLSKASNGRPVKLFLDRATELMIAGNRPSAYANIKVAAKKDGTITAWQSESWSTGGIGGGGSSAHSVRVRHPQPAQESHRGFDQLRRRARLARSQSPAGLLPHQHGVR